VRLGLDNVAAAAETIEQRGERNTSL